MRRLLVLPFLLLASSAIAQLRDTKLGDDLITLAAKAYDQKAYGQSAALYAYGLKVGVGDASTYYNAACSFALVGDKDEAFKALDKAIKHGWRNAEHLKSDSDLKILHADPRWGKTVKNAERAAVDYAKHRSNPKNAGWITSDVDLFWKAYEKAAVVPEAERAGVWQREYIDKGTLGLRDFMKVRKANSERLAKWVSAHPKFFPAVRAKTYEIAKLAPRMQAIYARMKDLYSESTFPDVYFLVGGFFGGGTVSSNGLLISAEMQGLVEGVPTDELNTWEKTVLAPVEELPALVAHELIHFQQRYPGGDRSLLRSCIQEGSASFIGTLIAGEMSKRETEQHAYGNAHEKELWEKFQKDMDKPEIDKWLYSGSGEGVRPDDLGYWMGYKICEAYYNKATDKRAAIRDILNIKDFKTFLNASGYADKPKAG